MGTEQAETDQNITHEYKTDCICSQRWTEFSVTDMVSSYAEGSKIIAANLLR